MAKQTHNMIMHNTQGMIGKQIVFKKRAGKRYVSAPPEVNANRKPTENQLVAQANFKRSITYAASAVKLAPLRKAYKAVAGRGQSAQNVAFQDAYYGPEVTGIVSQGYTGSIGNVIVVSASDNFKVKEVKVAIHNPANELIEEGQAASNTDGIWYYLATHPNPDVTGCKIKATAVDIPGNEGSLEVVV